MQVFLKRMGYIIYVLVTTVVLLEIAVRIWGYSAHYIYDPIYMPFPEAADIPYVHKPNLHDARARGLAIINTDSLGLRSEVVGEVYGPKGANEFRIAVLGDSFTFGEGVVETKDTYVAQLEAILNEQHPGQTVRVFNYGVSAYSVKEMVATFTHRVEEVDPDLVLLAIIRDDFNLVRTGAVDKWGYTVSYRLTGFVEKDSIFKRVLRNVHLVYLVRDMRYWFAKSPGPATLDKNTPPTYDYIKQFKAAAIEKNMAYYVVILPALGKGYEPLINQLTADEIPFVDLAGLTDEFTRETYQASQFDGHPSTAVHRRIAEVLAEADLLNLEP